MTARARIVAGVVGILVAVAFVSAQPNPLVGTWVLNTAKSKYTPGPAPKSAQTIVEAAGNGVKFTVHQVPPTGAAQDWSFTTNLDGKSSPITGNNPNGDATAYKRVNATTFENVTTRGGKETQRQTVVISADGKTRTVTSTGTNATGKYTNVAVYDRK